MTTRPFPLRLTEHAGGARGASSLVSRVLRKPATDGTDSTSVSILGHAEQRVANGSFAGQRLAQVEDSHRAWLGGEADLAHRASFVDSGAGTSVQVNESTLIFHALWCADERSAHVLAGIDPAANAGSDTDPDRLVRGPINPGDTVVIPAGMPHAFGPGILAYRLSVGTAGDGWAQDPVPTHGLSRFEGFNRRTTCAAGEGFTLERWKITQPLRLEREDQRWMFVTNLVGPVAISWDGGAELIGRAESRLLPASLRSRTFIPDGIAYVLCAYVPNLMRDVVAPLRLAGYRDDEIAALGTMGSVLGTTR